MPRFVILHHELPDSEHWDLMLEHGDLLLTWQLLVDPTTPCGIPGPARRIGDHRTAYLDYEGAVSGDRGRVHRIDRGLLAIRELRPDFVFFQAAGNRLRGWFTLTRATGDCWTLGLSAPSGRPDS
jgi:hypothetical protein